MSAPDRKAGASGVIGSTAVPAAGAGYAPAAPSLDPGRGVGTKAVHPSRACASGRSAAPATADPAVLARLEALVAAEPSRRRGKAPADAGAAEGRAGDRPEEELLELIRRWRVEQRLGWDEIAALLRERERHGG